MKQQDYYEILGVSREAASEEILQAYREMVQKFHPDLHPGDSKEATDLFSEKTKAINEAYDTLKDPVKRKEYDEQLLSQNENKEIIETEEIETETIPRRNGFLTLLNTLLFPLKVFLRPVLSLVPLVISSFLSFLGSFLTLNIFFIVFRAIVFLFQSAVLLVVLGIEVFLLIYIIQILLYSCLISLFVLVARWARDTPKKHFAYIPLVLFAFYFINRFASICSHFSSEIKTLHVLPGSGVSFKLTLPGTFLPRFVPSFFGFFSVLANRPFYIDPSKTAIMAGVVGACLLLGVFFLVNRKQILSMIPATAISLAVILLVAFLHPFAVIGANNMIKNELVGVWHATIQSGKSNYDGQLVITEDNLLLVNDPDFPTPWFPCCYRLRTVGTKDPVEFTVGGKNSIELAVFPLSLIPRVTNFLWGKNIQIVEKKGSIQSLSINRKPYVKLKITANNRFLNSIGS